MLASALVQMSEPLDVAELYARYAKMVFRRAMRFVGADEAEEVTSEVFVRALEAGGSFRSASSPATWLYRVTTNHCINRLRDRGRRHELWLEQGAALWGAAQDDAAQEVRLLLSELFDTLDDDMVAIGIHHYLDGMTHAEIARVMGVSRRTVGHRLEALRAQVEQAQ